MTDVELLERAREGDAQAFGYLVDRHRAAAYRAARAALGSPVEAEDVVQDACIAAFRKLASFRGDASFRTWLVAITWRRALSRRRAARRWLERLAHRQNDEPGWRPTGAAPESVEVSAVTGGPTPEDALLDSELAQTIGQLVQDLPRRLRDPLLLVGSGEFSYDEVARLVGAPVGTVKWRVSDARRRLKRRLRRLGFTDVT